MIKITNISKFYKDSENNITTGLKKVSMEFEKGEFVVIAGESGSGKSTLLNIISGMLPYEEGELYFCGKETSYFGKEEWEAYRRNYISVVYQDYNLIDSYTVLQNVETALLIAGTSREEATEKAKKYIDKVGLTDWIDNRASNLSSGQKQRLSIARALAKETDIIVADEPTGNLDEENGRQISAIFKELAEDHLVIMVTHNYDQVKDLATRKIRLYNNELAEDVVLKPKNDIEDVITKVDPNEGLDEKQLKKKNRETINRFVRINKAAQPKRNFLMFSVYVALMFAIFIFMGSVIMNSDDATSKIYESENMPNADKTRIIVARDDGNKMTQEDIDKISSIDYVKYIDMYDHIGDINYYYNLDEDYRIEANLQAHETDSPDKEEVVLLEQDKYMKSVTCLADEDITEGKNADGRYEVVVSEKDKDLLGETITFYFECSERWKGESIIGVDMKVVGVTEIEENQCFFSEAFCRDLSVDFVGINTKLLALGIGEGVGVYPVELYDALSDDEKQDMNSYVNEYMYSLESSYASNNRGAYRHYQALFIVNESLAFDEVIMSKGFYARTYYTRADETVVQQYLYNKAPLVYYVEDEFGARTQESMVVTLVEGDNKSGSPVIEISEALFDVLYPERQTTQICVYAEDYAYVDKVLSELTSEGYNNFSVFKVGAKEYDKNVVMQKLQVIGISIAATVGIFLIGIIIVNIMMKLKKKDFIVYDCLGMDHRLRYKIIKVDLLINAVVSCILVMVIAFILKANNIEVIANIMKYYRWYTYIVLYIIAIAMAYLTSKVFNRYLNKVIK